MLDVKIVHEFFQSQLEAWTAVRDNYLALDAVKMKEFCVGNSKVKVQYNPARIVSSAAKVDDSSLQGRKCFLCEQNRPAVQKGLPWNGYTVLVNPFPIFPEHLTIPFDKHVEQRISGRILDMMGLAQDLEGFTLFYNGPKCGASAPDHMHFQAGTRCFMPVEMDLLSAEAKTVISCSKGMLSFVSGLACPCFHIHSVDKEIGALLFEKLYVALDSLKREAEPEPMLNILCWHDCVEWNTVVFPRKQHRPSCYFAEGGANILLSPASVDMGGVFITPLEKDFEKITAKDIKTILDEVCFKEADMVETIKRIKR